MPPSTAAAKPLFSGSIIKAGCNVVVGANSNAAAPPSTAATAHVLINTVDTGMPSALATSGFCATARMASPTLLRCTKNHNPPINPSPTSAVMTETSEMINPPTFQVAVTSTSVGACLLSTPQIRLIAPLANSENPSVRINNPIGSAALAFRTNP